MLHERLAFLASLDAKALASLQKRLRKAPVNPLNIWFDFADDQASAVSAAAVELQEASAEATV